MQLSQVIAKAIHEPAFRSRFMAQPKQVLQEMDIPIPEEQSVTVVESRHGQVFFVLPVLSDDDINQLRETVDSVHSQRSVRSRILIKVAQDPSYKAELMAQPKVVLATEGLPIPASSDVTVLENSLQQLYIVLPHVHAHHHASHSHSHG